MQTFGIFGLYIFMVVPSILADTENGIFGIPDRLIPEDFGDNLDQILGATHNTGQSK